MQTMYINSTCVGNGCWKLKSVKAYCERKKVELKEAYCIVSTVDYAYTKTMNEQGLGHGAGFVPAHTF